MWWVLGAVLVAPVVWALLGATPIPALEPWVAEHAPGWLTTPVVLSTSTLAMGLLVGVLLGVGRARAATTHVSTLAHEFGHALTAALVGGRIDRITLARDGSGRAHFTFPARWPVRGFVVSFAGYVTPGVFGVASVRVAVAGQGSAWLAYVVTLLAVMLVLTVRSWWGALLAVLLAAGAWGLLALGSGWLATVVVTALAGALLGGGVLDAVGQWRVCRGRAATDAASMAAQTGLPVRFWAGMHLACAVGLAAAGLALPFLN